MKENYLLKEKVILEATLKLMFGHNFEAANIKTVANYALLPDERVRELFATDDELRMAAMEYAAVNWVNQLRRELKNIEGGRSKLKKLLRDYAAGSETHPDSLSLYIDVWKRLRDSKKEENPVTRQALGNIYQLYADVFKELIQDEMGGKSDLTTAQLNHLAWIMVVISDGFHIQSLIQTTPVDFDAVADILYQMIVPGLLKKEGKL